MFCGNIFTSTNLQNHKKNHMKKSQKRFHRVNSALFLSLSNAFEEQKFIPKISPKIFWSAPCFPKIVSGGQCACHATLVWHAMAGYPGMACHAMVPWYCAAVSHLFIGCGYIYFCMHHNSPHYYT